MIPLYDYIKAIHSAILAANEVLMQKNVELMDRFFEKDEGEEAIQEMVNDALTAARDVLGQEEDVDQESLQDARWAFEALSAAISKDADGDGGFSRLGQADSLRAKMVDVQYPHESENGVVVSNVKVPLITLVPLAMTQVSEVTLNSQMNIEIVDGKIMVSFPLTPAGGTPAETSIPVIDGRGTLATLEIKLAPQESSEGLRRLVEGYEKMLRAQIPY